MKIRLFCRDKPKIKTQAIKKDGYSGWHKCTHCHELIHEQELECNWNCCPKCNYHGRLSPEERIRSLADEGSFQELFQNIQPTDPLQFVDQEPYAERLVKAQEKAGRSEGVVVGTAAIEGQHVALGILDFGFMGGSMGSVMGERLTLLIEKAFMERLPLVIVSASGGARMQESTLSLMQMAKTSAALAKLHQERLLYISVLTNPTTGGVIASFAALGDITLAEPDALIAFTGPRIIEQTIGHKLPPGAQRPPFLLDKGMIDSIVHRRDLRKKISQALSLIKV